MTHVTVSYCPFCGAEVYREWQPRDADVLAASALVGIEQSFRAMVDLRARFAEEAVTSHLARRHRLRWWLYRAVGWMPGGWRPRRILVRP